MVLCTAVLLSLSVPALAQTPAIPALQFDDAIRQAIEKNPTIAQAATAIVRAETLLQQARALTRPTASTSVTNTTLDGARGFDGGVFQPQNQFAFSANVTVPVLAPARWAGIAQARDQISVADRSTAEVRQQIAVGAAEAYLAVIAAHRLVDVGVRALDAARAHLDYAQKRLEGGIGSRLNQLRASQIVAAEESQLENTRLALRRAQEALGVIVVAEGPVDAAGEPVFEVPASIDESMWMPARPDVQVRTSVQTAAERVVRDSWKDWMPTGSASFDPLLITPANLFQPSRTWRLTLTLTQPLYEGGLRHIVLRQREIAVEQSKLALTGAQIRARSQVRLAQESVQSFERALASARLAAERANEVLKITTSAFEVGATTNIEVIDAQRSARDAESVAVQTEDAVRRARLDLLVAIGRFPK